MKIDNIDEVQRLAWDRSDMGRLLAEFPDQCTRAIKMANDWQFRSQAKKYRHVVVAGMGGSAIAGDIAAAWLEKGKVSIFTHRNYGLPAWAGDQDLIVISSYSGETEESLSAYQQAKALGADILSITTGGQLEQWCLRDGVPLIKIPSGLPPRCALGYSFFSLAIGLKQCGLIAVGEGELEETIGLLKDLSQEYHWKVAAVRNMAKKIAADLSQSLTVIYATADHFYTVARRWANQLNENAKHFAYTATFPELCHNEIMAWEDKRFCREISLLILEDRGDHPRSRARIQAIKELIAERSRMIIHIHSRGESLLARIFSLIYLGDWASYYLALLDGVDPTPIASITKLKDMLKSI